MLFELTIIIALGLFAFGVLTGMVSGVLGVGGGIIMVPFLTLAFGLSQQEAQATSLLVALPTALMGAWTLHRKKSGNGKFGLKMGIVGALAAVGGSFLALNVNSDNLQKVFAVVLAVVAVRLLIDGFRRPKIAQTQSPSDRSGEIPPSATTAPSSSN